MLAISPAPAKVFPWVRIPGGWYNDLIHEYRDEQDVFAPSLSNILRQIGLTDYEWVEANRPEVLEEARERGHEVHKATHYMDEGDLDPDTVPKEFAGYVLAYQRFKKAERFEPLLEFIEHSLVAELEEGRYGTRVDRVGLKKDKPYLVELKTTSKLYKKACGVQLAGQALALRHKLLYLGRGAVLLCEDGSYRFEECKDVEDYDAFRAGLKITTWKLKNRVKLK